MVRIASLALAIMAAVTGTSAFTKPCPFPYDTCGFTLNNGEFGYSRPELINALVAAGKDPNVPGIIEHSIYGCLNEAGAIEARNFCGNGKCVEPSVGNPEFPGPNAGCKP